MKTFPCKPCGGTFSVGVPESPDGWAASDWAAFTDAQMAHLAVHPEELKVGMGTPPRKRDWVGCRCEGTCRCTRRRTGR